jgi:hypothetical protein
MIRSLFCFLFLLSCLNVSFGQITYQWLKDGVEIKGAINEKYKPLNSGNYSVRITNQNNCTSEVSTAIAFKCITETTPNIAKVNDFELKSLNPIAGESYQWYLDNVLIPGANSNSFKATSSGNYTLQIKDANGCDSPISSAISISILGAEKENYMVEIFPNPFYSSVKITFDKEFGKSVSVTLYDFKGSLVFSKNSVYENELIDLSGFSQGIYLVKIKSHNNENLKTIKLIKH